MAKAKAIRGRRLAVAVGATAGLIGAGAMVAGADGGLTVTPASGPAGSGYEVQVACAEFPRIFQGNTQDAAVQGTVGSFGTDQVSLVAPSLWEADETAGDTDRRYWATCGQAEAGTGYFDAESPHLWFGPRPQYVGGDQLVGRTTLEGTDCPPGTTAEGVIVSDGDVARPFTATIDEHGDWSTPLPSPVGSTDLSVTASCGDVQYDRLGAPASTSLPPAPTAPTTTPVTVPVPVQPPPAIPQVASTSYTG